MSSDPLLIIFQVAVLLYSVVIHEVAHGLVAYSLGDPTAKHMGRLTLNPIKHLDMVGSFLLPLFLVLIRSPFMFGYAKPVPYNPSNLSDRRYGPAKVAFAGPAANIALAVLVGLTLRVLPVSLDATALPSLLSFIVLVNLILACFNLFPIPPLDGHWLLMTFLPRQYARVFPFLYRNSFILLIIFVLFIFPQVFPFINWLFVLLTGRMF